MKLKKSLGQHFLRDKSVIRRIVDSGEISSQDKVVEIGAGGGALTEEIVSRHPERLVLIEFDPRWVAYLREKFKGKAEVIEADATGFDFSSLGGRWKFFGNLPYNVSTAILRNLLKHRGVFGEGIFMVQKEVTDRLVATGGKSYGYFPALLQPFFRIERLFDVHPKAFTPPPKVWSTVFRMVPTGFDMEESELLRYEAFLKKAFSHRRKKLKKNLGLDVFPPGFEEFFKKRAEEIPPERFVSLFRALHTN